MALTRAQMDARLDEHFGFEAADDVDGVLATLDRRRRARHRRLAVRPGARPRRGAGPSTRALFADLADGEVRSTRRLYGDNFMVDDSASGAAARRAGRSASRARAGRSNSACSTSSNSRDAGDISRENVWIDLAAIQQQLRRLMADAGRRGRPNQKSRTRKDLLRAAVAADAGGRQPDPGGGRRGGDGLARHRLSLFPRGRGAAHRGGARRRHARRRRAVRRRRLGRAARRGCSAPTPRSPRWSAPTSRRCARC